MVGLFHHYCTEATARINWDLMFRVIHKHILAEPLKVNMRIWLQPVNKHRANPPPCGVIGCFAGWTVVEAGNLHGTKLLDEALMSVSCGYEAARLLGLTSEESASYGHGLFRPSNGPLHIGTRAYAEAVADRFLTFAHQHGVWG